LPHAGDVRAVDRVRVRWMGHELHADADVALDPPSTLPPPMRSSKTSDTGSYTRSPRLGDILFHANPGRLTGAHDRTSHHRPTATTRMQI
jgi:hypothetical protein